jgi:Flp pilus assembly protein TadD
MWRHIALAAWFTSLAVSAGNPWICLRTPNFELYTTTGEQTGRDALIFFEHVRTALTEGLALKLPQNRPVTIIAFTDVKAFAPYRPTDLVVAYSMSMRRHDYIVMQGLVPDNCSVALHEFTHVIVNQAGIKLPLWLGEGFADIYSTLKPVGRKIVVGSVIPGRLQLAQVGLINLHDVLAADFKSPLYHEGNRVGVFYAESWALAHMLKFSEAYAPRFDKVLDAIGSGESSEAALQRVYNKTLERIQSDLATYVRGDHFREGVIHAKLSKNDAQPQPAPLDQLGFAVLLASIEARGPYRHEAIVALEDLAKANPGSPAPLEALTRAQLAGSDVASAIVPFRRAVEAGTHDSELCIEYAVRLRGKIPDADYVAALRLAGEINPENPDIQQLLAAAAFDARDYKEAVNRLHQVKKLERSQAFSYYRVLAFAEFQIGDVTEAKSAANRAQQYAVSPEDKRLADELQRIVNAGKPGDTVR